MIRAAWMPVAKDTCRIAVWRAALALLGAAGIALHAGCSKPGGATPGSGTAADSLVKRVQIETTTLVPSRFEDYIRLVGAARAEHDAVVSAEEGGRVERFFVDKGAWVGKGEPIAALDGRLLAASVAEAEADSALAAEQFARQEKLWTLEKIGTEIQYLQALHGFEQAAARLQGLRTRLAHTVIRAPFGGTFDAKLIEVGEMAQPGAHVARVVDARRLKVECGVPERFAADVDVGDRALVVFDVLPGRVFEGRTRFVGRRVDPQNRTFAVEIALDNLDQAVKPEMIANLLLVRDVLDSALVVPQQAIRRTDAGYAVYVVQHSSGDARAEERHVALGPTYANRTVIESGLAAGDEVVVVGQMLLAPGSRVEVVRTAAQAVTP